MRRVDRTSLPAQKPQERSRRTEPLSRHTWHCWLRDLTRQSTTNFYFQTCLYTPHTRFWTRRGASRALRPKKRRQHTHNDFISATCWLDGAFVRARAVVSARFKRFCLLAKVEALCVASLTSLFARTDVGSDARVCCDDANGAKQSANRSGEPPSRYRFFF